MGGSSNVRARNQAAQQQAKRQAKEYIEENLSLSFYDPKGQTSEARMAAQGEKLWGNRLKSLGYQYLSLQGSSISTHGPDGMAFKLHKDSGRVEILIVEVKSLRSSRILSALDETIDNGFQMSLKWLSHYANMIVAGMLKYMLDYAKVSLAAFDGGASVTFVEQALRKSEFTLYMLRAREYDAGWKLRGYELVNYTHGSGDIGYYQQDKTDPIQETYPKDTYLPTPPL